MRNFSLDHYGIIFLDVCHNFFKTFFSLVMYVLKILSNLKKKNLWYNILKFFFTLFAMETYAITSQCFHPLTCVAYTCVVCLCVYIYIYFNVTGIYLKQGVGRGLVPSFEIVPMRCLLEYLRE